MSRKQRPERIEFYKRPTYLKLKQSLAESLKLIREKKGLTQEQAAHQCWMPTRTFQQLEAGDSNVTFVTLARLLDGLGVNLDELLREF